MLRVCLKLFMSIFSKLNRLNKCLNLGSQFYSTLVHMPNEIAKHNIFISGKGLTSSTCTLTS
ncbi:hypothetical protein BLOT_011790 [Blomia tropicalis]|nr:hypothetical protein BLOT_011790 [Blomia tropicalis]